MQHAFAHFSYFFFSSLPGFFLLKRLKKKCSEKAFIVQEAKGMA
jgi:hypothetical protein